MLLRELNRKLGYRFPIGRSEDAEWAHPRTIADIPSPGISLTIAGHRIDVAADAGSGRKGGAGRPRLKPPLPLRRATIRPVHTAFTKPTHAGIMAQGPNLSAWLDWNYGEALDGYNSRDSSWKKRRQGIYLFLDRHRTKPAKRCVARCAPAARQSSIRQLRRQGIRVLKVKKQSVKRGGSVSDKDITLFTRQLATMLKAGVPLLQAFDIVGKGHSNAAVQSCCSISRRKLKPARLSKLHLRSIRCISTRCSAIWSAQASRPVFSIACSTGSLPTRKKSLRSREDQVSAVLSDRHHSCRLHYHGDHHDLRHSGIQKGLCEFWR